MGIVEVVQGGDASFHNRRPRTYTPGNTYVKILSRRGCLPGRLRRQGQRGKKRTGRVSRKSGQQHPIWPKR